MRLCGGTEKNVWQWSHLIKSIHCSRLWAAWAENVRLLPPSLWTSPRLFDYLQWRNHLALSVPAGFPGQETDPAGAHRRGSLAHHPVVLIHAFLCHSLSKQKERQTKKSRKVLFGQRRAWEQPVCNCLATAGAASVEVQRATECIPQSGTTHQRCKVKGCLRMHTNTHMSTHNPLCRFHLATLLAQNKKRHERF